MPKRKQPPKPKEDPAVDLLARPGMEKLAELTSKLLKVPKGDLEKRKPRPA